MIFRKKPKTILVIETFVDNKSKGKTIKVLDEGIDWFRYIVLGIGVPYGLWVMIIEGVFR